MERVREAVSGLVAGLGPRRRGIRALAWTHSGRLRWSSAPTAANLKDLASSLVAQLRVLIDVHILSRGLERDQTLRLVAAALTVAAVFVALAAVALRRRRRRRAVASKKRLSFKDVAQDAPDPPSRRISRQQTPARGALKSITGALKKDSNTPCPPAQKPFTAAVPTAAPSSSSFSSSSSDLADLRRTVEGLTSAVAGLVAWKQQTEATLTAAATAATAAAKCVDTIESLRDEQFQLDRAVSGLLALRVDDAAEAAAHPHATKEEVAALATAVAGCCGQMAALRDSQERLAADVEGRVGAAARELSALAVRERRASATRAVRVSPKAGGLGLESEMHKSDKALGELVENMAEARAGPSGSGSVRGKKGAAAAASKSGGSK